VLPGFDGGQRVIVTFGTGRAVSNGMTGDGTEAATQEHRATHGALPAPQLGHFHPSTATPYLTSPVARSMA